MKNLKINVPKGFEIDKEKSTFENIVFKPLIKNIREEIKTMDDVFRLNNTTAEEFYAKWQGFEKHEIGIAKEKLIVSAYNQGKTPDWGNSSESKYYPYFNMHNFSYDCWYDYYSDSATASRLLFLGDDAIDNLKDATNKFLKEYKESRIG